MRGSPLKQMPRDFSITLVYKRKRTNQKNTIDLVWWMIVRAMSGKKFKCISQLCQLLVLHRKAKGMFLEGITNIKTIINQLSRKSYRLRRRFQGQETMKLKQTIMEKASNYRNKVSIKITKLLRVLKTRNRLKSHNNNNIIFDMYICGRRLALYVWILTT